MISNNKSYSILIGYLSMIILFVLTSLSYGCESYPFRERADSLFLITEHLKVKYDLKDVKEKHFLPYVLSEISGLSYKDGNLYCVEDEGGKVYIYNWGTKKIAHAVTFGDPDDYEGVEVVDNMVYVLNSEGDLFTFEDTREDQVVATKYETPLSDKNDTEGLGYDPKEDILLIACKEDGDIKGEKVKGKAVFPFNLAHKKMEEKPVFSISSAKLDDFFEDNRDFDYEEERIKYEPSGIAYNPLDENYYLIASNGKLLVVLSTDGDILGTYPIAPRVLSQPEGICFSPEGEMFISSEGEGDKGYIIRFSPK